MGIDAFNRVVRHLRGCAQADDGLADGELLECYRARRDEAAFATLVRRHGPMVLGVCRRILRNEADAEDAFQAVFLVLVRKAGSIRRAGMVGNWLYGVAHQTALKAKAMHNRRHVKELEAGTQPRPNVADEVWRQAQLLVDDALSHLPDNHRVPIVLCDLEGRTIKEAARQLGWPQGTVASRLTRGRALLARRLGRSGLQLSAAALAALLAPGAMSAQVPAPLLASTLKAAGLFALGNTMAVGAVSATTLALTQGVLHAMLLTKLKIAGVVLIASMLLALSIGAGSGANPTTGVEVAQEQPAPAPPGQVQPAEQPRGGPPPAATQPSQGAEDKSPAALLRRIEELEKRLDTLSKEAVRSKKGGGFNVGLLQPSAPPAKVEVKVFRLRNAEASELANTLKELLSDEQRGGFPGGSAAALRSPRIATHQSTNSLLVQGTAAELETVAGIITQLDELEQPSRKSKEKPKQ
jgi:RNA polymerase sigma factor (sigma-70 family)